MRDEGVKMDAVLNFFKNLVLHPPFRMDPTVENTLIGLGVMALLLVSAWLWNRR